MLIKFIVLQLLRLVPAIHNFFFFLDRQQDARKCIFLNHYFGQNNSVQFTTCCKLLEIWIESLWHVSCWLILKLIQKHAEYLYMNKKFLWKTVNEVSVYCDLKNVAFHAAEIDNQHVTCLESISETQKWKKLCSLKQIINLKPQQ